MTIVKKTVFFSLKFLYSRYKKNYSSYHKIFSLCSSNT